MADLATELANLNAQAAELLAKYNGAFEKLDEETQNKIIELQDKAAELQAQIESLGFKFDENGILVKEDGSEISVGNALKLGGKSLDEIGLKKVLLYKLGSDITASSGVTTKIPFDTEVFNTFDIEVFDSENKEFVIPVNGVYAISSSIRTDAGASGEHARTDLAIFVNGNAVIANGLKQMEDSNNWGIAVNGYLSLSTGDRVTIYYSQNKGTDMTVYGGDIEGNTGGVVSYINIAYLGGE